MCTTFQHKIIEMLQKVQFAYCRDGKAIEAAALRCWGGRMLQAAANQDYNSKSIHK
jgi:hypothetical protein